MHGMMISKNLRYQSRNQTSRLRDCGTSRVVARRHCFRVRCSRDTPGAIRTVGIEQASVSKIRFEFAGTAGARWQTTAAMDETCSVRNISRNRRPDHQSYYTRPTPTPVGIKNPNGYVCTYGHHGVPRAHCETGRTLGGTAFDDGTLRMTRGIEERTGTAVLGGCRGRECWPTVR